MKKILFIGAILITTFLFYLFHRSKSINLLDACLCTEILSNDNFIINKNKMPSVNKCITTFDDFENAHTKCMESYKFENLEIKTDSLKSI